MRSSTRADTTPFRVHKVKPLTAKETKIFLNKLEAEDVAIEAIIENKAAPQAEAVLDHSDHPEVKPEDYHEDNVIIREESDTNAKRALAVVSPEGKKNLRVQAVVTRSSSREIFSEPAADKTRKISVEFHNAAMDITNNADPQKREVNAVQMVMENVFDWDKHDAHHGETMTPQLCVILVRSLQQNLESSCPIAKDDEIFDYFHCLITKNWLGDYMNAKTQTRAVIDAVLMAQNGRAKPLSILRAQMASSITFHERFFFAVEHSHEVPMKTIAQALELRESQGGTIAPKPGWLDQTKVGIITKRLP